MTTADEPVVMIVEDEPDVADTYQIWLQGEYDVRTAADGDEALASIDDTVDVVLLDRMMPGASGAEVLAELRERGVDCRVAMVSAVDPDFDVIEMGFDAYITKPPDREELLETIGRLVDRAAVDAELQEYYSLVARRSALEAEKTDAELAENDSYAELCERIEEQRAAADGAMGDMGSDVEFVGAVRELADDDATGSSGDES